MLNSTHDPLHINTDVTGVNLGSKPKSFSGVLENDDTQLYSFRTQDPSSLYAEVAGGEVTVSLAQDINQDGIISSDEVLTHSRSRSTSLFSEQAASGSIQGLSASNLPSDVFYLQVSGSGEYNLSATLNDAIAPMSTGSLSRNNVSSAGRRIPKKHWNASFLNLSRRTLRDYESYDFSNANAVYDLGDRNKKGRIAAKLQFDFGNSSPDGVDSSEFAMEAWTRVRLGKGKFYRLNAISDDGIRFQFRDKKTGEVITDLDGDWNDRSLSDPAYTQLVSAPKGGNYDFYVQYYDRRGYSAASVTLEKARLKGEVVSSSLNLRNSPSTINTTTIDSLTQGETFRIVKQVKSPTDSIYRNWYKIVTSDKQKGYIAADSSFVDIINESSDVVTVENATDVTPPVIPDNGGGNPGNPDDGNTGGNIDSSKGFISSKVWITSDDKIAFRSDKSVSGTQLGRLEEGTPVTILSEEVGGRYLNAFDNWYKIRVDVGGKTQEGYVAAYYVERTNFDGTYGTAISKNNGSYAHHIDEATHARFDPKNSSYRPLIEAAANRYDWLAPSVVAGIGSRESAWGRFLSPQGPTGTGDGGHGRGLMQIDDRFHQDFINSGQWTDAKANIDYGIDNVLSDYYDYLDINTNLEGKDLLRGAIASYNAGPTSVLNAINQGRDIDYYTTGQDYSWDVLNRAGWFQSHGWT